MKILIISRGIPTTKDPMWGNFEFDQARALQKAGHKVVILSVDKRFRFYLRKIGVLHRSVEGIDTYNIFIFPLPYQVFPKIALKISQYLAAFLFQRLLKDHGHPDIIHAHYLPNMAMIIPIKLRYKIPVVGTEHWSKVNSDKPTNYVTYFGNYAYKHIDKLVAVSNSLSEKIKKHFRIDSQIINNLVDTDSFLYNEKHNETAFFTFVSVGRIVKSKGYDTLIQAFKTANFDNNVKLLIIGQGNYYNKLQRQIQTLQLQHQVELLGMKSKKDISIIMNSCHTFVLASRAETFGVVFIEAMLMGIPVISTKCGGPEEFINESNGILTPIDDVEKLAEALRYMHENVTKYNREYISRTCRNKFSPEKIVNQLEETFNEVLNK